MFFWRAAVLQVYGNMASEDPTAFGPASIYISATPWFLNGSTAACAVNLTTTTTLNRGVLAMCKQTLTAAMYVTVAKSISVGLKWFSYSEIQPYRASE